jgi:uncharacterized protein RhaS with RHS repeats
VALRNIGTGHEAQIAYDANGLPQTITDSWTGVTWILMIAQRRVTSIAVAGRPDLIWTYQYDNDGNLMTVLAPGSATWRTYEYVANRMAASRDALGNLIESHTYDAQGWAIDSTGDVDEIASIQYDLPGFGSGGARDARDVQDRCDRRLCASTKRRFLTGGTSDGRLRELRVG